MLQVVPVYNKPLLTCQLPQVDSNGQVLYFFGHYGSKVISSLQQVISVLQDLLLENIYFSLSTFSHIQKQLHLHFLPKCSILWIKTLPCPLDVYSGAKSLQYKLSTAKTALTLSQNQLHCLLSVHCDHHHHYWQTYNSASTVNPPPRT